MDKLQHARAQISQIDGQMAELFRQRMEAVKLVAEHKKEYGLPILDELREAELLAKNSLRIKDEDLREFYVLYLKNTMAVSRAYQEKLLSGMRVAYSGTEGAFAHIAAGRIFPGSQRLSYGDFKSAHDAVVSGECDCAVLPLENSYAGEVGQVIDLSFFGPLYINGVYELAISQNLMALPGTDRQQITTVVSHPQALNQCAGFLRQHGLESIEFSNTAAAAAYVAKQGRPDLAAIASAETAPLYGLEILEHNINASQSNTTRFGVFSRTENKSLGKRMGDHFILLFTVKNEAGSLARAIDVIGKYGFNMRTLRSRPMKDLLWEYYFYLEVEGDIRSTAGEEMLQNLGGFCDRLKVAGSFSNHCLLEEE